MSQLTFFISQLNHQIYNISKLVCSVCGVFEELVICKKEKKKKNRVILLPCNNIRKIQF